MNNDLGNFLIGLFFGALLGAFAMMALVDITIRDGMNECELNLPRTKQCIQVWVPQTKETK